MEKSVENLPTTLQKLVASLTVCSWAELAKGKRTNSGPTAMIRHKSMEETKTKMLTKPTLQLSQKDQVKHIWKIISEFEIDFNQPRNTRPRGLINKENTCFLHVALQPLIFCPPFVRFIQQFTEEMIHESTYSLPLLTAMTRFVKEFEDKDEFKGLESMKSAKWKSYMLPNDAFFPDYLYLTLHNLKSTIRGRQEDAHEFLEVILNGLHEELASILRDHQLNNSHIPNTISYDMRDRRVFEETENDSASEWFEVGPKNKVFVTRKVNSSMNSCEFLVFQR